MPKTLRTILLATLMSFAAWPLVTWTDEKRPQGTNDSCTCIIAGKNATVDGSVITSHTEAAPDCRIHVVPSQTFPKGVQAPVYYGILDVKKPIQSYGEIIGHIPQAEKTYAYIHSGYPHINEFQLAIGESTLSQRDELKVDRTSGKQIITVEQAMAFALQRCKKAREAIGLITSLVEKYGFLPSTGPESEALCIADPQEAWVLEIFSVGKDWNPDSGEPGAIWAAQRVPDDHAAVVPNWSIIKEIDLSKPDEFMASRNYKQFAVDRGWYDPQSGRPFVWQEIYAPIPHEWATSRFWRFYTTFAPYLRDWPKRDLKGPFDGYDSYHQYVEPLSIYPFSAKPEKKLSVQDVIGFQRCVYSGTIYDMTADANWFIPDGKGGMIKSPLATPFPTKDMRELLDITWRRMVPRTGYGMVAHLRGWLPDPIGGIYWFYVDNPYISAYVPIYAGVEQISPLYGTYDPDKFSEQSARWAIDFVDNLLYLKWQEAVKDLKAVRDPLEAEFFSKLPEVDARALELYKKNPAQARKFLTDHTKKCMERVVKLYQELRELLISKYTNNKQGL